LFVLDPNSIYNATGDEDYRIKQNLMKLLKIDRVHHIAILCSDYERSKDFYVSTLGC
jgi:hypothetical protein